MLMTAGVRLTDGSHDLLMATWLTSRRHARTCGHLAVAIGLVLTLGGCVSAADRVAADIESKRGACRQQTFKSNVERARCHNAAEGRLGEIWGADLAAVRMQSRVVIAEKTDRNQMTEAEAELEFAKVNADLTSQVTRRAQAQQLVDAQYEAALAQRRSQRTMQMQQPSPGSFDCVSRPSSTEVRTECRDSGVIYNRTNAAIGY